MTEMLNKEFSRTSFLKGGGALVVGFGVAGKAGAAVVPYASSGPPPNTAVDSFIVVHADNTASIGTGRVELGQGSVTGLLMIAAEELDMDMSQLFHLRHDTNVTPNTGTTSASTSITSAGPRVRSAAATARQALLSLAATQLGVPAASLTVSKGVVSGGGRSVTYGQLIGGKVFNVTMAAQTVNPGVAPAKSPGQYTIVGTPVPRIDIPDKVTGKHVFTANVRVPEMLHGRLVLPRGQMVYGFGAPVVSVDESSIKNILGARVVRRGDLVGVVAPTEYAAIQAAAHLKVKWADPPSKLPGSGNTFKAMRAQDSAGGSTQVYRINTGNIATGFSSAARVLSQTYAFPFNGLQPIGPEVAVAHVTANGAVIYSSTANAYSTRAAVMGVTGLPESSIRVLYYEGSSSFGGAQTSHLHMPQAAAVMSQIVGKPVRLQNMRWDENGWQTYSPGELVDIRAAVDAGGTIVAYDTTAFYPQYKTGSVNTIEELLGTAKPGSSGTSGIYDPAPMYHIPNQRFLVKSLPLLDNWLKVQWIRAGSAPHMNFASEQMIDELANSAGMDPVAFRVKNLTQTANRDPLLALMNAVTQAAKWQPKVAASNRSGANVVRGRGFAMYFYGANSPTATIADIEVNKKTGKIVVKHLFSASSTGLIINPELVENQISAAMAQMTSRALVEQLTFSKTNVTSLDWVTYPILRFKDSPKVTAIVLQRKDQIPAIAGEPVTVSAPAAIANAFFDATGVRLRQAPMSPGRVRAALRAAAD